MNLQFPLEHRIVTGSIEHKHISGASHPCYLSLGDETDDQLKVRAMSILHRVCACLKSIILIDDELHSSRIG